MPRNYYKAGEWNIRCMVCDRKIKSGEIMKRWDGLLVCPDDYENRHPMDFLRARAERISVPFAYRSTDTISDAPTYPVYPYCTQEGSSGVAGWGVAGCMRPSLGFPNGLPVTPIEIPDEPVPAVVELNFLSGPQIYLIDGNFLILEVKYNFTPVPTPPTISNALLNMTGGQVLLMSNSGLLLV